MDSKSFIESVNTVSSSIISRFEKEEKECEGDKAKEDFVKKLLFLLLLVKYYNDLKWINVNVNEIIVNRNEDSQTIANIQNGINIKASYGYAKLNLYSLQQNVPKTLLLVPAGKRYLVYQNITYFDTGVRNFSLQLNHVNPSRTFLLGESTGELNLRGLFTQTSTTDGTTVEKNSLVFPNMILLEEGESLQFTLLSAITLSNVTTKIFFWEIDQADNIPIFSFYKSVPPNDSNANTLFTTSSTGSVKILAPYQAHNINTVGLYDTSSSITHLLNNLQNTVVTQSNRGIVYCVNNTGSSTFTIPFLYHQDDSVEIVDTSTFTFSIPVAPNGSPRYPGNNFVLNPYIPPGNSFKVKNETSSGWTAGQTINLYGTYYQF
jgi:hypothetical protein